MASTAIAIPLKQKTPGTLHFGVKAGATVVQGAFVAQDVGGYLWDPAPDDGAHGGDFIIGLARVSCDNTDGEDGDLESGVSQGVFEVNYTGSTPDASDVGGLLYLEDNQTVTLDNTGGPIAGTLKAIINPTKVWIETPYLAP